MQIILSKTSLILRFQTNMQEKSAIFYELTSKKARFLQNAMIRCHCV